MSSLTMWLLLVAVILAGIVNLSQSSEIRRLSANAENDRAFIHSNFEACMEHAKAIEELRGQDEAEGSDNE